MEKSFYKEKRELQKIRCKKRKKTNKFYFFYLLLILCLAYVVDELATNISTIMQKEVLDAFFGGQSGLDNYTIVITLCSSVSILTFIYKALADKIGRKPLLVADLFGMAAGMFLCSFSNNLVMYAIGLAIIFFFTPADLQVIYVLETSNPKRRAFYVALTKAIGIIGISLVPLFRRFALNSTWQLVFLFPAIIGLIAGVIALFFAHETAVYYDQRTKYLTKKIKNAEQGIVESKEDKIKNAQGGIIAAIKYMFYDKKFLWLFLVVTIFAISTIGVSNFSIILQPEGGVGGLTQEQVDLTLLIYPFAYAAIQLLTGLVSDRFGRKVAAVVSGTLTFISILAFVIGVKSNWTAHVIGIFLGFFLGGFYASIDTFNIISSETAPTNLRSSILSVIGVASSVGGFIATGLLLLFQNIIPKLDMGFFSLLLIAPATFVAMLILFSKIDESKKRSLTKD